MKILLITGESGAGKTPISLALCRRLEGMCLRSRDIARFLAHQQGYRRARDWIEAVTPEEAIRKIDEQILMAIDNSKPDATVVIDGAYAIGLLEELDKRFDKNEYHVIEISAPHDVRVSRSSRSMPGDTDAINQKMTYHDKLKTQAGMNAVINKAELTIENSVDIASAVDEICAFVDAA